MFFKYNLHTKEAIYAQGHLLFDEELIKCFPSRRSRIKSIVKYKLIKWAQRFYVDEIKL